MESTFEPKIVAFVCNWCTYAGADLAGTSRTPYEPNVRIIKLPCTGRISPLFIVKALEQGADGVLVSGCHPGDCHYTAGNFHARRKYTLFRDLLHFLGVEKERVQFSWVSAAEGKKWAEVVHDVVEGVRKLGPRQVAWGEYDRKWKMENGRWTEPARASGFQFPTSNFQSQTSELQAQARDLLQTGAAGVVVGYGQGSQPTVTIPIFVTSPEEVGKLVWNEHCRQNLSVYLTKDIGTNLGKVALVTKGCDERSVIGLIQEQQLAREEVILLGMPCSGVSVNGHLADQCTQCQVRQPSLADYVIGSASPVADTEDPRLAEIAQLEQMAPAERWNFWQAQFARCLKCYACRAVCPLCYCERCIADKTQPRWIPSSAHGAGNLAWNIVRAFHLAGRCVDCGACAQACPANIRLDLINLKLAQSVKEAFDYVPGRDPTAAPPLTTFREDDRQEFIR